MNFRSKGSLDTGKVAKKKSTLKASGSFDDGQGGGSKSKSPNMRRAASPMLGRKSPMPDKKMIKTPSMLKYVCIEIRFRIKSKILNHI